MATYYVDYEGAAGTGDGTSFANRAGRVEDCSFTNSSGGSRMEAGDVCRIKKTPDPTVLGTGRVDHAPTYPQYNSPQQGYQGVTWSTTEGQTSIYLPGGKGYKTGDRIMIWDASTSTPTSDGTEGKNLAGIYSITLDTSTLGKAFLDGFTAANTDAISGQNYRAISWTPETVQLSGTQPWKVLSSLDGGRPNWTVASSGDTTTDHNIYWSDWSSTGADWVHPAGTDEITVTSNSTTGLKAYVPLGSATDLSAYQQISLMCKFKEGNQTVNTNFSIRLCTDNAGVNSVHTIPLERRGASTNGFHPQVTDFGAALNSSIQSIAIYQDATIQSTHKFCLSNICACKASSAADSVTHMSAIGLNTAADPVWYPVGSLCENGIISLINYTIASRGGWPSGYYKAGGCFFSADNSSATIYKREYIVPAWLAANIGTASNQSSNFDNLTWVNSTYDDTNAPLAPSAAGGLVSGGWDTTNMSTQEGHTFIRGAGKLDCYYSGNTNVNIEKVHGASWNQFIDIHGGGVWLDDVGAVDCFNKIFNITSMHNARKINIKYAIGTYTSSSSTPSIYISGQDWYSDNINASAPVTNFEIGYANGAFQNNAYAFKIAGVNGLKFNKINVLFAGKQIDFNQNCNGTTIEEIRAGGSPQSYCLKFEDGGSNTLNNTLIKKLIIEANRSHSFTLSNGGSNNVITELENKDAEEFGWGTYEYHNNSGTDDKYYRFSTNWTCGQFWIGDSDSLQINGGTTSGNIYMSKDSTLKTVDLILADSQAQNPSLLSGSRLLQKNWNNQSGVIKNYIGGSSNQINPETTTRHTASGYAWKMTGTYNAQLQLDVMRVIVNGGSLVTIKGWVYRDTGSYTYSGGTGMRPTIIIKANPDIGLNSDVVAKNSFANGDDSTYYQAWEEITATFTPTAAGVVSVVLLRDNSLGSSSGPIIWDDLSVSQA